MMYQTQQNFIMFIIVLGIYYDYYCIKVLLCLTDTLLYIYICVKHFGMANIKKKFNFLANYATTQRDV